MSQNRNPEGKNQYGYKPKADDPVLANALRKYHKEALTDNALIAKRLRAEHGIAMCAKTVQRRRKALGLLGSEANELALGPQRVNELVLDALDKDPSMRSGVASIRGKIAHSTGEILTFKSVSKIMHTEQPEGFALRDPTAKKIKRTPVIARAIHRRWSGDGHDKLNKIGIGIWGIVDQDSGKWLGGWVMPSNRFAEAVAACLLLLIIDLGGMPRQLCTDSGSETTIAYGVMNALREKFHPELAVLTPHVYMQSIHNISIERSWKTVRFGFGDNAVIFYQRGIAAGIYDHTDPDQRELRDWVWGTAMKWQMDDFIDFQNGARGRKQKHKQGPSRMSRNSAYSLLDEWNGDNNLLPVDVEHVRGILNEMGGEQLHEFATPEYSARAQGVFDTLGFSVLNMYNAWSVFEKMYPLMYDTE